jgi:para-aminobenzoate synthetase
MLCLHSYTVNYSTAGRIVTQEIPLLTGPKKVETIQEKIDQTFFHWVADRMESHGMSRMQPPTIHMMQPDSTNIASGYALNQDHSAPVPHQLLFWGGLVGYFGYEMKCETLATHPTNASSADPHTAFNTLTASTTPDAAFIFADRFLAFDHELREVYMVALDLPLMQKELDGRQAIRRVSDWFESISSQLKQLTHDARTNATVTISSNCNATELATTNGLNYHPPTPTPSPKPAPATKPLYSKVSASSHASLKLRHSRNQYIANISKSLAEIKQGETYEVCLTTQIQASIPFKPSKSPSILDTYMHLRKRNPAPYAALLQFNSDLAVLSSSPERFLRCDGSGWIEMKPIKGTIARPSEEDYKGEGKEGEWEREDRRRREMLQTNEKDRAENLMIVDLIRNDLNQIASAHTVSVPSLMHIESYATVHQLVTTVKAHLHPTLSTIDAIKAAFPPGSMTGAPKLRTVKILEELEGVGMGRGVYSGCLGFISLRGETDMNVVIRTAVLRKERKNTTNDGGGENEEEVLHVDVGAGGAVVYMSDPVAEFDEMVLKAQSVLPT